MPKLNTQQKLLLFFSVGVLMGKFYLLGAIGIFLGMLFVMIVEKYNK